MRAIAASVALVVLALLPAIAEGQNGPGFGPTRSTAFRTRAIAAYPTLLTPRDLQEDSVATRGLRDGKAAAREEFVAHRTVIAFIVGVPTGFLLPLASSSGYALVPVLAGGGIIALTAMAGDDLPDESARPSDEGLVYQRAFLGAYASELRRRRRNAALWGAVPGGVIGLATGIWAITVLTDFT